MGFLRFYLSLLIDAGKVLVSSIYLWVSTLSALSFLLGIISSWNPGLVQAVRSVWRGFASWYFLMPIIILFVIGLMQANYKRFTAWTGEPKLLEPDASFVAHLEDLREKLLRPMLDYIDDYVLPILNRECGNVILHRGRLPRSSAEFMDEPTELTETFGLGKAVEPPLDPVIYSGESAPPKPIRDGVLYTDARSNHFQDLIRSWERLLVEFDTYNEACLSYVTLLRTEILQGTPLPELDPGGGQQRWVFAKGLALLVFYRQLGLQRSSLEPDIRNGKCALVYQGSQFLAQDSASDIAQCIARLEELYQRTETIQRLNDDANRAKPQALTLRTEIDHLLATRKLLGKCGYASYR